MHWTIFYEKNKGFACECKILYVNSLLLCEKYFSISLNYSNSTFMIGLFNFRSAICDELSVLTVWLWSAVYLGMLMESMAILLYFKHFLPSLLTFALLSSMCSDWCQVSENTKKKWAPIKCSYIHNCPCCVLQTCICPVKLNNCECKEAFLQ